MAAMMKPEVLTIKLFRTEPGDVGMCDVSCPNENLAEVQRMTTERLESLAWFKIRPLWLTQGAQKPPACEGRLSVERVFCAGGGEPPRVKLAGAEAVPGPAG